MNDFEQTELQDIVGPIAPDTPVHWVFYTIGITGILLCLMALFVLRRSQVRFLHTTPAKRSKLLIASLRKTLKRYETGDESLEKADLDTWWRQLVEILKERGWKVSETMSFEELETRIGTMDGLSTEDRESINKLLRRMDSYKYSGGLNGKETPEAIEAFRRVIDIAEEA